MPSATINSSEEYNVIVGRNQGLGQLFHNEVQRHPSSLAIVDRHVALTYEQLHLKASQLAHGISERFLKIEEPVGIVVNHGFADVVAQMAIIYAGGTCAAMDPSLPDQQIQNRLDRLGAKYILIDSENMRRELPFTKVVVDEAELLGEKGLWGSNSYPVATSLAHRTHIIHTSGTTSEPKAVQIAARSILQVVFHAPFEPVKEDDAVAHVNNTSFDVSLFDIWAPLLRGARIVVLSKSDLLDLPVMAGHIERMGITVMATTTALFNLAASIYPRAFAKLRICFIGGETANVTAIKTIFEEGPPDMLINAYGPTECCIFCLAHHVTQKDVQSGSVSIGMPIGRTVAYIADELGKKCEEGELWIGGAGVSPGYINQEEKSARSFTTVEEFTTSSGELMRFYRTGDIVRRRPDGQIEYIGRRDNQVKVRGFRIELEAVEKGLLQTGQVSEAVAMKIEAPQEGAGSIIVAYATPSDLVSPPDVATVLDMVKDVLPDYMVPYLELIPKMPLNSHAKVDRKHLTQLFCQRWQNQTSLSNTLCKDTSSILASLWANILASPKPSYRTEDDFFNLGGTSLQASLLISQIYRTFDTEISLLTLYDNSTIGALTSIIDNFCGGKLETVRNESEIWINDTRLADDLPMPSGVPVDWCRDTEGRIFFTGATGFVGAFMLADLLCMPHVHQVGCLVRAESAAAGMERIRVAMTRYGLWKNQFAEKLLALPGLLEDKYLGMGLTRFNELANWASTVFHLGARVNYTQPYSLHRPANTLGTVNVVRFACAGRTKPIHYVSSISCFGPTGYITGATSIDEDEPLLPHLKALPYDHGYAQSQWVVEQLLRRLMDRGFPIVVYRPGFIIGHSETGACNPDDFFSRLILACREMGCYPALPNQRKEFVPVDYVSSTILNIASSPDSFGHSFHIVPPNRGDSVDMNDTMDLIGDVDGFPIQCVSYQEWIDKLVANTPERLLPLVPMLAEKVQDGMTRWELYKNMPIYQVTNTMRLLKNYPGSLQFPVLGKPLMKKYLDYLQTHP